MIVLHFKGRIGAFLGKPSTSLLHFPLLLNVMDSNACLHSQALYCSLSVGTVLFRVFYMHINIMDRLLQLVCSTLWSWHLYILMHFTLTHINVLPESLCSHDIFSTRNQFPKTFSLSIYVCISITTCVGTWGVQQRASDTPELGFHVRESHDTGAGNQSRVLCKSSSKTVHHWSTSPVLQKERSDTSSCPALIPLNGISLLPLYYVHALKLHYRGTYWLWGSNLDSIRMVNEPWVQLPALQRRCSWPLISFVLSCFRAPPTQNLWLFSFSPTDIIQVL